MNFSEKKFREICLGLNLNVRLPELNNQFRVCLIVGFTFFSDLAAPSIHLDSNLRQTRRRSEQINVLLVESVVTIATCRGHCAHTCSRW